MRLLRGLALAAAAAVCSAQGSFEPLRPPALPLAVRSPYMNTNQGAGSDGGNGGFLPGQWPVFWFGAITGWTGYVRVDNITYIWMGDPSVPNEEQFFVTQTNYVYSPTRSTFTFNVAGVVTMTVDFLSPVLPDSLLDMSLPYAYMDVRVQTLDGHKHDVQLYTDISAEWVSGDRDATAQWDFGTTPSNVQPKEFGAVPSPTFPAPAPETTFATRTAYTQHPVSHGPAPTKAPGQGRHPAGVKSPPTHAAKNSTRIPVVNRKTGGVAFHEVWRQQQLEFAEFNQQAEWGHWFYATKNIADLTHQSGADVDVRAEFINNGFLADTMDPNFRAISDDFPVFGFAVDMGVIQKGKAGSALFELTLNQDNCNQLEAAQGNITVPCLWTNYFDTAEASVAYFYGQFNEISAACIALDNQVKQDTAAASPTNSENYYALVALATRQAFASLAYTNSPTQPWIFLKEISSDGDIQTVDIMFPFFPIAIYHNATMLRYLLDPLFINQEAGFWPLAFAIHDLGTFPNATGYNTPEAVNSAEKQPLEECGNMIIMALAYAQRTGDNAYLAEHYDLLKQWNNFLVNDSLIPGSQLSTDDFLGPLVNDTNLALKGIVGIEAMAQIANLTGHTEDGVNFTSIAHNFIHQWYNMGISFNTTPKHEEAEYNMPQTFDLLYNLYGDAVLGLQLVKKQIYNIQSDYYPTIFQKFGVPLRSGQVNTKVDWELWVASIASESTQNQFISVIAEWLDQTTTSLPFTDFYNTQTGGFGQDEFIARPAVGAMYALLALESAPKSGFVEPISLG